MALKLTVGSWVDEVEWDRFVASQPGGTLFQTTHWASFVKDYLKMPVFFASARDESGELVGVLQFWNEPVGYRQFLFERRLLSLLGPALKWTLPTMQWLYGPLVREEAGIPTTAVASALLAEVEASCSNAGAVSIGGSPTAIHGSRQDEFHHSLLDAGYTMNEWATYLTPLGDDLWESFDRSVRKSVRRTQKHGIGVERVETIDELRRYYEEAVPSWRQRGARVFSFENYAKLWEHLMPVDAVQFFVARRREEQLGGLGVWRFNGILTEFGVVRSQSSIDENLYVGDLIKWEIMKWGRDRGDRLFDLAGVSPVPQDDKEIGIDRYKRKWGGDRISYSMYEKRFPGMKSSILNAAERVVRRRKSVRVLESA